MLIGEAVIGELVLGEANNSGTAANQPGVSPSLTVNFDGGTNRVDFGGGTNRVDFDGGTNRVNF